MISIENNESFLIEFDNGFSLTVTWGSNSIIFNERANTNMITITAHHIDIFSKVAIPNLPAELNELYASSTKARLGVFYSYVPYELLGEFLLATKTSILWDDIFEQIKNS